MAAVQRALQDSVPPEPRSIPYRTSPLQIKPPSTVALPLAGSAARIRNSHIALDTFSPVNQNGSFEFDRVLKSGYVQKRTRKTKVRVIFYSIYSCLTYSSIGLEAYLPRPSSQPTINLQRQKRRETTPQNPPRRPDRCRVP